MLEGLSDKIAADYLPLLHRLVDNIALLDMLAGFSLVASGCGAGPADGGRQYVRPALTEAGPLALVEARHPVLECLDDGHPYQPNDTYLALNSSFHIITGGRCGGAVAGWARAGYLMTGWQPTHRALCALQPPPRCCLFA